MRPFLSPLFDPQAYIKTVIKDGKSEECFNNIVSCIEDINLEIKGYISQHKVSMYCCNVVPYGLILSYCTFLHCFLNQDELMSGMQDVATLADRYTNLSATSQKLHRNIERLKKEVYGLLRSQLS